MNIRTATIADLGIISEMEAKCFPPAEAASPEAFKQRLTYYPNHFWLLEENGIAVSCINGFVTNATMLSDEMYADATQHDENGDCQMIFGLMTLPQYQGKGYAARLMKQVILDCQLQGRSGIVLTCKDKLVDFYEQFGYRNEGRSMSKHGGVSWNEMRLTL